jgi:hypothetical protein
MPKLAGVRERRHQPYYDTLVRAAADTAPTTTVQARTSLFQSTNLGNQALTNMSAAGTFPSDQTFIVLSVRCHLQFVGSSALTMYAQTINQLYLTLTVGDKPQFGAPCWYFPAGGGISGCDSATPNMSNGVPSTEAILKLAKPITITARQHFEVTAEFFDLGSTSVRTSYINASTTIGSREIKVLLDGIHTRDVL